MSYLEKLKKNRSKSLEKLTEQLDKISTKSYSDPVEEKFWKPTRDKAGNGFAIIRFLPPPEGEEMPFIRMWDHGFQGPTGLWYIEKSLTTLNQDDPVSEYNSKLWNTGLDSDKEIARKQKRRLKYISNIYVVKDPGNPENEGKVFLYAFGKKIFDKLNDLMYPQFEDEDRVNPFDIFDGANFRLKIRQFEGYPNYDKSEFDAPSPLSEDESELEAILGKMNPLQELLDPKHFKSYSELKTKLYRVLDLSEEAGPVASSKMEESDDLDLSDLSTTQHKTKELDPPFDVDAPSSVEEEDDDLSIFKELARA